MLTHIRLDQKMEKEIQEVISKELFVNKSDFIRDAIRKSIEDYKTKIAKEMINSNFKSYKGSKITKKEKQEAFEELLKLKKIRTDNINF